MITTQHDVCPAVPTHKIGPTRPQREQDHSDAGHYHFSLVHTRRPELKRWPDRRATADQNGCKICDHPLHLGFMSALEKAPGDRRDREKCDAARNDQPLPTDLQGCPNDYCERSQTVQPVHNDGHAAKNRCLLKTRNCVNEPVASCERHVEAQEQRCLKQAESRSFGGRAGGSQAGPVCRV